eukprot:TRINITY_DN3222_c0_g1_i1.p1 TRINITY_DN3222_c0_g1~~TRINITY_DN3222_c0_g1_i1.p1  ORF type:complete len:558 (+),score=177.65 TRINITY_DN3222_c0_g1_i1:73-1746(+)
MSEDWTVVNVAGKKKEKREAKLIERAAQENLSRLEYEEKLAQIEKLFHKEDGEQPKKQHKETPKPKVKEDPNFVNVKMPEPKSKKPKQQKKKSSSSSSSNIHLLGDDTTSSSPSSSLSSSGKKKPVADAVKSVQAGAVEAKLNEIKTSYHDLPQVQVQKIAEYMEEALSNVNDFNQAKFFQRQDDINSRKDIPLSTVEKNNQEVVKQIRAYIKSLTSIQSSTITYLLELLRDNADLPGAGVCLVLQLIIQLHPSVIVGYDMPSGLSSGLRVWTLCQSCKTSPSAAFSQWYRSYVKSEGANLALSKEAFDVLDIIVDSFMKKKKPVEVDEKIMGPFIQQLISLKANKSALCEKLYYENFADMSFSFPSGVPKEFVARMLTLAASPNDEIRNQALEILVEIMLTEPYQFDTWRDLLKDHVTGSQYLISFITSNWKIFFADKKESEKNMEVFVKWIVDNIGQIKVSKASKIKNKQPALLASCEAALVRSKAEANNISFFTTIVASLGVVTTAAATFAYYYATQYPEGCDAQHWCSSFREFLSCFLSNDSTPPLSSSSSFY